MVSSYDHAGCPSVPAGLVHVFSVAEDRLVRDLAFQGTGVGCATVLRRGVTVVTTPQALVLIDAKRFNMIASLPIKALGKPAVTRDESLAYVAANEGDRVAVLELVRQVGAIALMNSTRSDEALPVAILTTKDFDATSVDPTTLTLNGSRAQPTSAGTPATTLEAIQVIRVYI